MNALRDGGGSVLNLSPAISEDNAAHVALNDIEDRL
jgi:hypothetical protein